MKPRLSIILAFFFVAACYHPVKVVEPAETPSSELVAIDSLMWQRPDSALSVLMDYMNDGCKDTARHVSTNETFDNHYAQLLASELLYKNDYAQTNRTELQQAVAYFDSLVREAPPLKRGLGGVPPFKGVPERAGDSKHKPNRDDQLVFLAARAHYINGVGYYENDNVVDACTEYLKALETMEEWFEEKELVGNKAKFMAFTYNRLGDLFVSHLLAESAIVCYKEALSFCKIEPTSTYGISIILYNIGIQFDIIGQKDSADFYYDKAIDNMPDNYNLHYRDIIATKALLSFDLGQSIDSALKDLKQVLLQAEDEEERLTRFLTIGSILYEGNQFDSARVYLDVVFHKQADIQSKALAAEYLLNICQREKDSIVANRYAAFLASITMSEYDSKPNVSKLNDLFQNHLIRKREQKATKEKQEMVWMFIRIVVPCIIMVATLLITAFKISNRKKLIVQEAVAKQRMEEESRRHEALIETERQRHLMEQAAIAGRLKRSNEILREMKDQICQQYSNKTIKLEPRSASFIEEPICHLILERVNKGQFKSQMDCTIYKEYSLDKEHLLALREAVDYHFGQFTVRIAKSYPALTKSDLDYCCLYLLGLSDADVAALMQRAYNTVCERKGKLRKVFDSEKTLSLTLRDIAQGSTNN